jgi:competence protein ComEA
MANDLAEHKRQDVVLPRPPDRFRCLETVLYKEVIMQFKSTVAAIVLALLTAFAWAVEMVNINAADAVTLAQSLQGIGPNKAAAIVHYREANGPFVTIESLTEVQGIGARTVEINRDRITLE